MWVRDGDVNDTVTREGVPEGDETVGDLVSPLSDHVLVGAWVVVGVGESVSDCPPEPDAVPVGVWLVEWVRVVRVKLGL